jgi:hypothetical protein
MRFFLYTYAVARNYEISHSFGVVGAKKDGAGLPKKFRQLRHGDIILIRNGVRQTLKFFGYCCVCGRVLDQSGESPYKNFLWSDEERAQRVIYPLRVAVDFVGVPSLSLEAVTWEALDTLGFNNKRGQKLLGPQAWGKKFMGNFLESQNETAAFSRLVGLASA